ncbi:uncharacterized protein LOC120890888 [Ictidomys tridecemlineatus]|uniref:EKC/KEOPS complex subunit LAGE3-like isoform X1 n=1 Tax=Ictidomys tridecemlineatus TaxID=43179 RepID=UPI00038C4FA9|nr:EKC/KEOPS complex subunit LAGE3-like isoform X1 [Ictidomys tridecemlineatus]
MEAPGGSAGGTGGAEGHEDGQGGQYGSPAPGFQGISGGSIEEGSHSDFSHPSGPSGLEVQSTPSNPDEGSVVREGVVAEVDVGEEAVAASQSEQALRTPGPSGDAATSGVVSGSRLLEFSLTVPFRSPLEAEMAQRSLVPDARQQEIIHKEFTVNGSDLAVRWTTEDPVLFRTSVNTFLDQLSLVMRNIRRIGVPALLKRGKGKKP